MLRTLAINSNQIVLSFGVLIAFLSPKQSEIEKNSLESISKSRIQGVWDPAHSTQMGIIAHSTWVGIPYGCRHFPPGCITSGILAGWRSTFSECFTSGRHFRMGEDGISTSTIKHIRIHRQRSPGEFRSQFCTVPQCSPEASRYVQPTFWDILL